VTRNFSIEYVASHTTRSLSLFYTLGAFWAGQAGSLMLWAWVLGLYGAIVVWQDRVRNRELMVWVVPALGLVELGLGGFWDWDPVENASLLPWLTGTAYLHSVRIQETRGMLKVWNVFLIGRPR
jgi:cytochrome c biogenesis factor